MRLIMKVIRPSSFRCAFQFSPILFILSIILFLCGIVSFSVAGESARIKTDTLPANGIAETIMTVPGFGRYAVTVKSPQGTALQLIDRMAGPGQIAGLPGETDGRIDTFLDRGDYKIRTHSHENGTGEARLAVHAFKALNTPTAPRLVEFKLIESSLADFQQRAYWIEIKKRRTVAIEAAGRSLADLRLLKDGNWLVDATPHSEIITPQKGKPLYVKRLAARLNPGLYQVIAYGGPPLAWAQTADSSPFHLRWGIPTLADAGRRKYTATPFGTDRYRVPRKATYFRLELPEAEDALLFVSPYDPSDPFTLSGKTGRISKKSLPPVTEITTSGNKVGYYIIAVQREAGKPYILQHFKQSSRYRFKGAGRHWIGTIHSGHLQDSVDATSLLFESMTRKDSRLIGRKTITLDPQTGWRGNFNLLAPLSLFIEVTQAGDYIVRGGNAKARYQIAPFFIKAPENYVPPDFQESGHVWPLDKGIYVLAATPKSKGKGILDLEISPKRLWGAVDFQPRRFAGQYTDILLKNKASYTLYMNQQPGVRTGVVIRRLPIDLTHALPVTQHAGETIDVEVKIPERGQISAVTEDGRKMDIAVDQGPFRTRHSLPPGTYRVRIRSSNTAVVRYNLGFDTERLSAETPLPRMSEDLISALPRFTTLTENHPIYLDIGRKQSATFHVRVDKDALYQLESTGLLETEGNLRTRTIVTYDRRSANGVGRNFLIQQYLGQGNYQLTLKTLGKTRGHLGVKLSQTVLVDGETLTAHIPARLQLAAGQGVIYRFNIPKAGRYRLQTLGLDRQFMCRLEDEAGWPLVKPGVAADFEMTFSPGAYRLVLLPQQVDVRSVTLLEPIPPPPSREGHGPHELRLNESIHHVWTEPAQGEERTPDRWCFSVPAAVDAKIELSAEMGGVILKAGNHGPDKPIAPLFPGRIWEDRLKNGDYCLEVKSFRPNNLLEYDLALTARQLVEGYTRRITAPDEVPLSVGKARVVALTSFGNQDVNARLYNEAGELLAKNDDQAADWNFHMALPLDPGFYRLALTPVGKSNANTIVRMNQPEEITEPAHTLPAQMTLTDTRLHTYPMKLSAGKSLFVATANSTDAVGLALEVKKPEGWQELGRVADTAPILAVALDTDASKTPFRLRAWSVDRRGAPIHLKAGQFNPTPLTEKQMRKKGITVTPIWDGNSRWGMFAMMPERPGLFQITPAKGRLLAATAPGDQLNPVDGPIGTTGAPLWGVVQIPTKNIQGNRLTIEPGKPLVLTLPAGRETVVDLPEMQRNHHLLIRAESRDGLAAITAEAQGSAILMGTDGHVTTAVAWNASHKRLRLWNAAPPDRDLSVTLLPIPFSPQEHTIIAQGISDLALTSGISRTVNLAEKNGAWYLNLPAHTAASLFHKGRMTGLLWSGKIASARTVTAPIDQIVFYYSGQGSAVAGLSPALSPASAALDETRVFTKHFPETGALRMNVRIIDKNSAGGYQLVVQGPGARARFINRNGRIFEGKRIDVHTDGILTLFHNAGLVAAWLEGTHIDPWTAQVKAVPQTISKKKLFDLNGTNAAFSVHRQDAAMLRLNTACPVIARIETQNSPPRTAIFANGADLTHFVPPGETDVVLISPGKSELSGTARFHFSKITPISEGLGPKVRLGPGETRIFSFTTRRPGEIGMGVRGTSDQATCRITDRNGITLGTGLVQMHRLSPGRYFLAVENPSGTAPIEAQPVVVGIRPPDKGPPDKVIREYMALSENNNAEQ